MNKILNFANLLKENIFAFSLSIIIHALVLSFLVYNMNTFKSMIKANINRDNKNNIEKYAEIDDYVILVDPIDIEEKKEYKPEPTKFVSDRNIQSRGEPDLFPNLLPRSFKPFIEQTQAQEQEQNNTIEREENKSTIIKLEENQAGDIEIYRPERAETSLTDKKVPSTFDEAADRAIVFSSETGKMRLGTRAMPYYWYFKGLVTKISQMWGYTIPNQAHFLGLIRSDDVEILLSIDENGDVEFVEFLRPSRLGQNSLNNSCQKAIEYTGNIGVPPEALYEEYQENGKIYIPFRFIYQNFNDN